MKKNFVSPQHEIIRLNNQDIITTSGTDIITDPTEPSAPSNPGGGSGSIFDNCNN